MLVLHGIYDHGQIQILDKDLPDIRTEVEILILEKNSPMNKKFRSLEKIKISKDFHFSRDELNER